jgi:hypothetical protein
MPGTSYEDVIKLLLRIGISQVGTIFEAGGRVETGGKVSFTPIQEGRKSARASALRAKLLDSRVLDSVLLGERAELPETRVPVDTIPPPPAPPAPAPGVLGTDPEALARLAAGQQAALP